MDKSETIQNPCPPLSDEARHRGMRYAFLGQSVGILPAMLLTRSAFGPLFLKHLGASDSAAMWVFALPGLLFMVQIPLSLSVPASKVKTFLLGGWALFGALLAATSLVPWAVGDVGWVLSLTVGLLFFAQTANAAATTFWFPLLSDLVPADRRGRFFGRLRAAWGTLLFGAVAISALYLGPSPTIGRFQVILLLGCGLIAARNLLISRVPPPVCADGDGGHGDLKSHLRYLIKTPAVRRFFLYFTVLGTAAGFLGQPLVLHLKDLGFHARDNMLVYGFSTLGTVIALLLGGNAVDTWGTRAVFRAVHIATVVVLLAAAGVSFLSADTKIAFAAVFTAAGAVISSAGLACTAHLFCFMPRRGRVFYLTFANFMLTLGPAAAMFLTGTVLRALGDVRRVHLFGVQADVFSVMLCVAALATIASAPLLRRIGLCAADGHGHSEWR